MSNQKFFEQALANFTFETACGGAIRHLADSGYTVAQIMEKLDYPASREQVQEAVLEHLCSTGVLLRTEPAFEAVQEKPDFVLEYDRYGKASFRRAAPKDVPKKINWNETQFSPSAPEVFSRFLEQKLSENGVSCSYASCDFGLWDEERLAALSFLDTRKQEYIRGIPWEKARMYHRLNPRMREILEVLYRNMEYSGICYFLKTAEKVRIR